jgi:hypothetical protein
MNCIMRHPSQSQRIINVQILTTVYITLSFSTHTARGPSVQRALVPVADCNTASGALISGARRKHRKARR